MFEEIGVFYRGLVLGLMIAAPVGPIGLLCMRRTIQKGIWIGFATGLGAAFADALRRHGRAWRCRDPRFVRHYQLFIRILGLFSCSSSPGTMAWTSRNRRPSCPAASRPPSRSTTVF